MCSTIEHTPQLVAVSVQSDDLSHAPQDQYGHGFNRHQEEFAKSWQLVQPLSPLSQARKPHQACQHDRSTMHSVVTNIWLQSVLTACHILENFHQPAHYGYMQKARR
ncbi:hypothetical protein PVAP13_5NG247881 [Panicum virgatum]|uniref:Uncharacterized protein n=1 Tax=Panicum virgatum TaxID=38727 RepID=A0A8T0RVY4_PANVG|nr:hypothetical protein PVAP13_5NG247881 [Panicum virgatum]